LMDGPFHDRVGLQQPDGNQFVALSINLKRILQGAGLPGRGREAIVLLLAVLVVGVSLLLGAGGGLYRLVPGVLLCLLVAVLDAWVLLVEILR
jgi:hypothetical protein